MKFWDLSFCDCCYIRICLLYSPRMWRWSYQINTVNGDDWVFSTYVEVIPDQQARDLEALRILHVCGGDPKDALQKLVKSMYSPRMWRWSRSNQPNQSRYLVFSTYVEVILCQITTKMIGFGILHVCGGDPFIHDDQDLSGQYSPRMWRWSLK